MFVTANPAFNPGAIEIAVVERPLNQGELRMIGRSHAAIVMFYAADAALLTIFGLLGAAPAALGLQYGFAGLTFAGATIFAFHRGPRNIRSLDRNNLGLTLGAAALMLATALRHSPVGGLMVMSLMAVISASALQLTKRQLGVAYLACAGGAAAVLLTSVEPLQWPMATLPQRAVTALWVAWLLAKCAATNVAGTQMRQLMRQANTRLAAALSEVEKVASTDDLTVLPNRRSILEQLDTALASVQPGGGLVGVALFDIDHFKSVNDRHGHAVGDEVLRVFGGLVTGSLRPHDSVGRYGGEEFLLVLRDLRHAGAARDATDRMRRAVEGHAWGTVAEGLAVTASAGVALVDSHEDSRTAIRRADAALYAAKAAGRNRVVLG